MINIDFSAIYRDTCVMSWFEISITLITLTLLEVILGIDNLVFLSILSDHVQKRLQSRARKIGLSLAWMTRLALLASAVWLTKLTTPLFSLFGMSFSGRQIFLGIGGVFLLIKAIQEIHTALVTDDQGSVISGKERSSSFLLVVTQIAVLDIVFSLDSVLTAVGLTHNFTLMAVAITIAILLMIFASEPLSNFIHRHPTIKMLALSFLILIGILLVADGLNIHIPRGYLYSAMGFSLMVEMLNLWRRKNLLRIKLGQS